MITIINKNNRTFIPYKHKSIYAIIAFLIILFVAYFQLFYNLDKLPLRVWDEGKNAVSAYEMYTNGNYLVRYYEGQPDGWGFKPPFLTWNQVIAMRIFGVNEFSIRFPSALYALFTAILIFYFFLSEFKRPFFGLFGSLILLTTSGYLKHHIARYGDHDSILVFFLVAQLILFYKYIRSSKTVHLGLFTSALVLASLTKGIAGLFFVPGIVIYLLFSQKLKQIITDKRIYFCILTYLLVIGGYYFIREISSPGYIKAVWENELLPRYTNTATNYKYEHTSDYFFYIRNLWNRRLTPWIYLAPCAISLLVFSRDKNIKPFFWYILIIGISFMLTISGGSKGIWYDAPIFPVIAIYIALGFLQLYIFIKNFVPKNAIPIATISILFVPFLYLSIQYTKPLAINIQEKPWNHETQGISYFLRDHINELSKYKELGIAYDGYHSHVRFYANIATDNGTDTDFVNYQELNAPSIVIASQTKVKEFIENNYIFIKEKKDFNTNIYKIKVKK